MGLWNFETWKIDFSGKRKPWLNNLSWGFLIIEVKYDVISEPHFPDWMKFQFLNGWLWVTSVPETCQENDEISSYSQISLLRRYLFIKKGNVWLFLPEYVIILEPHNSPRTILLFWHFQKKGMSEIGILQIW